MSTLHLSTTGKRQKDKHKKDKKIQNKTGPATHIKLTHKPTNTHACYSHVICTLIGKEGETKLRKKKGNNRINRNRNREPIIFLRWQFAFRSERENSLRGDFFQLPYYAEEFCESECILLNLQ